MEVEMEVEVEVEGFKRWRWRQGKSGGSEVERVCPIMSFRNIDPIENLACPSAYLYEASHPDKPPKLFKTP